ncbi:MAG TPA: glycoside hydrolase family 140 protein [Thermoguttaceae bacterium]|nr:glycoside hydrolase family 140 protein [Thermoguttaceae bacterium]HUV67062.1 glycoside hydrolase family 140 protein [Sedimentisphaerales bacterium]
MHLWNRKLMIVRLILAVMASWIAGSTADAAAPWEEHGKLRVSANGRHLEHADGTPMLWIADTGWALFYKLRREEVIEYLDQRSRQGFNVIQAVVYWYPHGEDGPGPTNAANQYGHAPFEGGADDPDTSRARVVEGGSPDQPNDYWDNADFIVRETRRRGLYLAMLPCWGRAYINPQMPGSACVVFTAEQGRTYGRFLGQRYSKEPHIVWVLGGDANATAGAPGEQFGTYRAMAEGIGQGATGRKVQWNQKDAGWDDVMMTYHPDGDPAYNSSNWFHSDAWLDFNGIETWKSVDKVYETVARDCSLKDPTKPTMLLEGAYEQGKYPSPGEHVSAHQARRQAYHTFFAGGAGHTYGGFPVWDFTRDPKNDAYQHTWHDAMKFPGAPQVATVLRRLLEENQWWTLSPQPSLIEGDPGEGQSRIVAMCSSEGNRILVYLPTNRAVKVELDLAGSKKATARWFDPRDGRETQAGDHACGTTVDFKPPEGWEDAVLVVVGK